jgi:predicted nucleic acid-binding protein
MRVDYFLDTNILIYAAAGKNDDRGKFRAAERLVLDGTFGISGQVLAEFYVNVLTKPKVPITVDEAEQWIDRLSAFPVAAVDELLVKQGIAYSRRFQISYWDGAILGAAERLGAPILYTEDLSHDQLYGSVRVRNPFYDL